MVVTIHQPEHLPWLGFFDKALQVEIFVILDNVQYRKSYFQNRNKIRTREGWVWITIPVRQPLVCPINEIKIDSESRLSQRHLRFIQTHYQKAPYFGHYFPELKRMLASRYEKLVDLNCALIQFILDSLGIKTPLILASKLGIPLQKGGTDVNFSICKFLGADGYLSGISGREYLDHRRFEENGIRVIWQEFYHPIYRQLYEPFIPCMSSIDLLFNYGPKSLDILRGVGVERVDNIFE